MAIDLKTPLSLEAARALRAGDQVTLTGIIYTARDAAHKRLVELIHSGGELPIDLSGAVIYYVGPTPPPPGYAAGSAGPTTSYRMDAYSPQLIRLGQTGMIGKGRRGPEVVDAMKEFGAVYFGAIGGAGALISQCIKHSEVVAYPELGAEAIHRFEVDHLPLTVVIDSYGDNLYDRGMADYLSSRP